MKSKSKCAPKRSYSEKRTSIGNKRLLATVSGIVLLGFSPSGMLKSQSPTPVTTVSAPAAHPTKSTSAPLPLSTTNILTDIAITQTNDPFASSSVMVQKATIGDTTTATLTSNASSANLKLHGVVIGDNGHTLALISLDKTGIHVVREGDQLSLSTGSRAGKVSIKAIHRKSIEIDYGTFDNAVTIR